MSHTADAASCVVSQLCQFLDRFKVVIIGQRTLQHETLTWLTVPEWMKLPNFLSGRHILSTVLSKHELPLYGPSTEVLLFASGRISENRLASEPDTPRRCSQIQHHSLMSSYRIRIGERQRRGLHSADMRGCERCEVAQCACLHAPQRCQVK